MDAKHTPGPWFVRHCDDERHMCMTVISTKNYGPSNDSQFDGEDDTVAITYHQCAPFVSGGFEIDDCDERDANARLIAAAPDHAAIAQAMCASDARWEAFSSANGGEFCIGGMRHATKLDEFGVPIMTSGMRAALATGAN